MTSNECKTFRRELDEADPNQQLSIKARDHLRGCAACRSFDADQRALHSLIASLEPVAAPSDFDFRLRARLAREKSGARNGGSNFLRIPLPIAAAALVLLMAVAGVTVKNLMTSSTTTVVSVPPRAEVGSAPDGTKAIVSDPAAKAERTGPLPTVVGSKENRGTADRHSPTASRKRASVNVAFVPRKGGTSAIRESALSPALVLGSEPTDNTASVVRVPLDARALQISIDDGHGATRTISLPTVSFGSQRLMASQSFMPTGASAKGVW